MDEVNKLTAWYYSRTKSAAVDSRVDCGILKGVKVGN